MAFTLVELLVVVAIIGILVAIVVPVVSKAIDRARQTDCMSNQRQFSMILMTYRHDHEDQLPKWLSTMHRNYDAPASIYLCRADRSGGANGSKPDGVSEVGDDYSETDDTEFNAQRQTSGPDDADARITRCSYMYEFSAAGCTWNYQSYLGATDAEIDRDGNSNSTSWAEAKYYQLYHGDVNHPDPYGETFFPVVRCFYHYKSRIDYLGTNGVPTRGPMTINAAYSGNVFVGPVEWELLYRTE
jgi:prepilin-type N-terminal cleavage/methylation domain-containing protein